VKKRPDLVHGRIPRALQSGGRLPGGGRRKQHVTFAKHVGQLLTTGASQRLRSQIGGRRHLEPGEGSVKEWLANAVGIVRHDIGTAARHLVPRHHAVRVEKAAK